MGNVELLELFETIPEVQCSECLLNWNQGIVYCTCGHLLRENQSSRRIHRWTLDLLSIPNYVIKKRRLQSNRHVKTEEQIKHYLAHNFRKRCNKNNFEGIRDRFQKDSTFRDSPQNWSNWRSMHPDGQGRAERFHLSHVVRQKELVDLSQHIWTQWTDETPFRLQLEKSDLHRFLSGSIRNGIRRLRHPAHLGGSGTIPDGVHKIKKVKHLWARERAAS